MPISEPKTAEFLAWEQRLGRMAGVAAGWQERIVEPLLVESGSALAGDDAAYAEVNVSSVTAYSLATATEHLRFCFDALEKTSALYPTAYLTVLRTTVLAASHAVWILSPKGRTDRLLNTLEFLADDLRSQLTATKAVYAATEKTQALKDEEIERLQERQAMLQPIADKLKPGLKIEKCQINNTAIIETMARTVHDKDFLVGATNWVWRTGSAAAHGGRSFAVTRLKDDEIRETSTGTKFSRLYGDLEHDIGPAAATATLALSKAFELYELRRLNHRR